MADTPATPDFEARLAKIECAIAEMSKQLSAAVKPDDKTAEMAKITAAVTELSAKLADRETIAKEFSKHVGTSAPVATVPAADATPPAPTPVERFVTLAKKHFVASKSKVEAIKLAMAEDGPAYKAFRDAGANISWA